MPEWFTNGISIFTCEDCTITDCIDCVDDAGTEVCIEANPPNLVEAGAVVVSCSAAYYTNDTFCLPCPVGAATC